MQETLQKMYPKIFFYEWVLKKKMGGGLTSVVQNYFDKGVQTRIMSSPNADMIAVSLACPKDPKSPYSVYTVWGLLVSSVRKLLEKVGDLRDIAILVQSIFGIFGIY